MHPLVSQHEEGALRNDLPSGAECTSSRTIASASSTEKPVRNACSMSAARPSAPASAVNSHVRNSTARRRRFMRTCRRSVCTIGAERADQCRLRCVKRFGGTGTWRVCADSPPRESPSARGITLATLAFSRKATWSWLSPLPADFRAAPMLCPPPRNRSPCTTTKYWRMEAASPRHVAALPGDPVGRRISRRDSHTRAAWRRLRFFPSRDGDGQPIRIPTSPPENDQGNAQQAVLPAARLVTIVRGPAWSTGRDEADPGRIPKLE
jgi:hypothetical protein